MRRIAMGTTIVMLLVIGLAMTNFGVAQTSSAQSAANQAQQSANQAQSAADQAQQSANQAQGAASNTADQAQGEAEKQSGGITGAVTGAGKAIGHGAKTGAVKTKEVFTGKQQSQSGAEAQGQAPSETAQSRQGGGNLPQSGSPLPLIGLLGLGTVGLGVWKARFRN